MLGNSESKEMGIPALMEFRTSENKEKVNVKLGSAKTYKEKIKKKT